MSLTSIKVNNSSVIEIKDTIDTFSENLVIGDSIKNTIFKSGTILTINDGNIFQPPLVRKDRVRVIYNIHKRAKIQTNISYPYQLNSAIFADKESALSGNNYLQLLNPNWEHINEGVSEYDGYLAVSLKHADDSNFITQEDIDNCISLTYINIIEGSNIELLEMCNDVIKSKGLGMTPITKFITLKANHLYKIELNDWQITSEDTTKYKFYVNRSVNEVKYLEFGIRIGDSLQDYYLLSSTTDADYYTIGFRADSNEDVNIRITDITKEDI